MSVNENSPAMRYRMGLKFDRLDSRKSDICIAWTDEGSKGVFVSIPAGEIPGDWVRMEAAANMGWTQRYGCSPPEDVELLAIETLAASAVRWIPDSGMRALSDDEISVARRVCEGNGFTLDMLFLLVEGLGWTLGKPVPYTDPGWLAVWAEEELCGSYMLIVCHALGMDEPEWGDDGTVMPEVVAEAYAAAGSRIGSDTGPSASKALASNGTT